MAVHVDKNNPQEIIVSSRGADGQLAPVGVLTFTFAGTPEVATIAVVPTSGEAVLGGTTAAVTLTFS
jgi:hypothetical protein